MILSISINFIGGIIIDKYRDKRIGSIILLVFVLLNISSLVYYKYFDFILENLKEIGIATFYYQDSILLPIGISFFTFQSISYLVDIYRKDATVQTNPLNLGLYISLFPQLIAGPIVRYHDVAKQIAFRTHTSKKFADGILRFSRGLGKKIIISNPLALIADQTFIDSPQELTLVSSWIGIIAYSLQIYFDFSGYSDMAIGLGKMFGFRFLENFNYPYISKSIQEFWRRWHISLSSWFRDYLYIPLGGSRKGMQRTYLHLIIVFFITGLWHGSSWNFVVWGLFHGLFIILERLGLKKILSKTSPIVSHLYVLIVVIIGWVFFRSPTLEYAIEYLSVMIGLNHGSLSIPLFHLNAYNLMIMILAIGFSTPIRKKVIYIFKRFEKDQEPKNQFILNSVYQSAKIVMLFFVIIWSLIELAQNSYNPFIYFRF